jgi:polyisoprenoid-binding protein YceI
MKIALLTFLSFLIALPALAQTPMVRWKVDPARSEIVFADKNAGHEFTGKFTSWDADITFDPKNLAASSVKVSVNTGSAVTGNNTYDGTLPSNIWFDAKTFPQATFSASKFKEISPGNYEASGSLKLKGVAQPVVLPFTVKFVGAQASMTGEVMLNRPNFGVGTASDPTGDWVSKDVKVSIKIEAKRTE